jgi:DNA invertase Pin-like site-specific DNA recombinase
MNAPSPKPTGNCSNLRESDETYANLLEPLENTTCNSHVRLTLGTGTLPSMLLLAYTRVSSEAQEDGHGLDVQADKIRAWADRNSHKLAAIHVDVASGRLDTEGREGLAATLAALRAGDAHGLVVYRLDRLARDLVVQEQLLAEVRRYGCDVFSTSESEQAVMGDDPDDPSRKLIRQVIGAVSEFERAMIVLRLRAGRERKRKAGGYAGGTVPYGYTLVDGSLEPDPHEQTVIGHVVAMRERGRTLRQIVAALNEAHISARHGGSWHPSGVKRIVDAADAGTGGVRSLVEAEP